MPDNLITASPHSNGWNKPAERQGGVDKPSTEIAPRAGRIFNVGGPSREREKRQKEKDHQNLHLTAAHNRLPVSTFCPHLLISHPQNPELHHIVIDLQAECLYLCFY